MNLRLPLAAVAAAALAAVAATPALAHAHLSPPVAIAKEGQTFSLAVPTEKENVRTVKVALTVPDGFSIDSFVAAAGWTRRVQSTGSGEDAVVQRVTWTAVRGTEPGAYGVPPAEDAFFQFLAEADSARTYTFQVEQTYSDGSVVDWSGGDGSDTPAPTVEAVESLDGGGSGGGSGETLAIVALAAAGIGLVLGAVALARGSGRDLA
jgi:uncharacterized protein YcnI